MQQAKVKATMEDGTFFEASGPWMTLADRVAFERQFGMNVATIGKAYQGAAKKDTGQLREEWTVFWAFRLLARSCPVGPYKDFIERVAEMNIDMGGAKPDPTSPDPQPAP